MTAVPVRGTVTILIPTKNEEAGIGETLRAIPLAALAQQNWLVDLLVVDGSSRDRTREIAANLGARVVVRRGNGKGNDFRAALSAIKGDIVVMIDADNTYPAEAIPEFVEAAANGSDVVMGTRLKGRIEEGAMTSTNRFGNRALSLLASVLYGRRCTDVCTGMWAFKRSALDKLHLNAERFEIEAELFAQSAKAGLRIKEIPIQYRLRSGKSGLSAWKDGPKIAAKLARKRIVR
ncbi:MAG TPA: glycosyltransferase family 2 protein [Candidatus Thermoplasmatota archaeon]|nr:glycosyltransferase family 2 protein [Candidatus Thermoplasmatota archaeon]